MTSRNLGWSLLVAGVVLIASVAVVLFRKAGVVDGDAAIRLSMVVTGAIIVFYGNLAPKASPKRTPRGIAIRRFSGWAIVLGGLANIVIWTFAPMSVAPFLAMAPLIAAALAIYGYCAWTRTPAPTT